MDSGNKVYNANKCERIQKILIEIGSPEAQMNLPSKVSRHIDSCQQCREFSHSLSIIKNSMMTTLKPNLKPHASTLRQLMAFINKKPSTEPTLIQKIQSFLYFPIPAYQVLTGLLIIAALTIGFGIYSGTGKNMHNASETFYFADSTHKLFLSKGKTVYEDTVWARYMVTF